VDDEPRDRAVDLAQAPRSGAPDHVDVGLVRPHDPLRLCIFSTVALIAWLLGPWALAFFAGLGIVGYARARRAGLLRSRCLLGDTRLLLLYLTVLLGVSLWAVWHQLAG
jgi:hypothetical protein